MVEAKSEPTIVKVEVNTVKLEYLVDQMDELIAFFEARDEMNARVHLAGIRLSPITIRAREIRDDVNALWMEAVAELARA